MNTLSNHIEKSDEDREDVEIFGVKPEPSNISYRIFD